MNYIMELRKIIGSRPIIMTGANVLVLNEKNELLMQLRTDNGCWGLAGGALEPGEMLEDAAKRELFEETGLIAKKLTLFNVFSGEEFYYKYPHGDEVYNVIISYICKDYEGQLRRDQSEVKELRFFPLTELPPNLNPPERLIIKEFLAMQKTYK